MTSNTGLHIYTESELPSDWKTNTGLRMYTNTKTTKDTNWFWFT
jgi:hypothetical protein